MTAKKKVDFTTEPGGYWTQAQVSQYVNIDERTLERMRLESRGPVFYRLNRKTVRYLRSDIDAWCQAHKISPST